MLIGSHLRNFLIKVCDAADFFFRNKKIIKKMVGSYPFC